MTTCEQARPEGLVDDAAWPRAGARLATDSGAASVDLALLGVPTHATSLSATRADHTPAAVRAALWRFSLSAGSRQADLSRLMARDAGDVLDPDADPQHELREAADLAGLHAQVRTIDLAEVDATADTADLRTVPLTALCVLEAAAGLTRRA